MPQITDIKPQKRQSLPAGRQGRFNIYVDGRFAFALSAETLVKEGLEVDQELSPEEIEKLVKENEFAKAYERVLKFFSYRPRSERELQNWFVKKQIGEELQKLLSQKLKDLGYLNDEEFARWWIEQRVTFKPVGKRLLNMELRQKGVKKDLIVRLLDCYIAKDSEIELARKVTEKKLKTLRNLSPQKMREKLAAALLRRGFDWETIKEVVDPAKRG